MADRTLAHRAQNVTVTEKLNLPPTAAPTNHGKTVAAWFTTYAVIIAFVVAGIGVTFALEWLFWTGMGLIVVSLIVARLLVSAGYGQGGAKTRASQAAHGGH